MEQKSSCAIKCELGNLPRTESQGTVVYAVSQLHVVASSIEIKRNLACRSNCQRFFGKGGLEMQIIAEGNGQTTDFLV